MRGVQTGCRLYQSSEPAVSRLFVFALIAGLGFANAETRPLFDHAVGMYVHQHWPYKHPYAARTWTLEDWRGYADGLKKLGYNTIMIWPLLEDHTGPSHAERSGQPGKARASNLDAP